MISSCKSPHNWTHSKQRINTRQTRNNGTTSSNIICEDRRYDSGQRSRRSFLAEADGRHKGVTFFQQIDMTRQSGKLKTFLAYAFGAPMPYSGKMMKAAHAHLEITEEHFNVVAGYLGETLTELGVPVDLIDEVMHIAAGTKADIVSMPAAAIV